MTATCRSCHVRTLTLFAEVPENTLASCGFQPYVVRLAVNEVLMEDAVPHEAVYEIRHGLIKLQQQLADGSKRIIRLLGPGDTLGLQTWQTGPPHYHAIALDPTELCRISYPMLEQLRVGSAEFNNALFKRLGRECHISDMWISQFSTGAVPQRLAYLLLYLAQLQGEGRGKAVKLLSREDMAAILGVRQESVSRAITLFRSEGLITPVQRNVYQLDKAGLRAKAAAKGE